VRAGLQITQGSIAAGLFSPNTRVLVRRPVMFIGGNCDGNDGVTSPALIMMPTHVTLMVNQPISPRINTDEIIVGAVCVQILFRLYSTF